MREILITKKGYFVCAKHPFLIIPRVVSYMKWIKFFIQ